MNVSDGIARPSLVKSWGSGVKCAHVQCCVEKMATEMRCSRLDWRGVVRAGLEASLCRVIVLRLGERVGSSVVIRLQGRNSEEEVGSEENSDSYEC